MVGDIRRAGKLSYWVKHLIKAKQEEITKFDLLVAPILEGAYPFLFPFRKRTRAEDNLEGLPSQGREKFELFDLLVWHFIFLR